MMYGKMCYMKKSKYLLKLEKMLLFKQYKPNYQIIDVLRTVSKNGHWEAAFVIQHKITGKKILRTIDNNRKYLKKIGC